MTTKNLVLGFASLVAALVSGTASAEATPSPWLLRATAIAVLPDADSDALDLDVPDMTDLAVDVTYHLTPHFAVNVLATILNPEVESAGDSIGSVGLVPPIVTAQYVFNPGSATRFYAGAGFNYNLFHSETGQLDALDAEVEDTVGWVLQIGMDHRLSDRVMFNLDLKYLSVDADVEVGGDKVDELELDAVIVGAGLGFWL